METVEVELLNEPHSKGQFDLIYDPSSSVNFCGRRWGKTMAGVGRIIKFGMEDAGLYWWVGQSWRSASMKRAWRLLKHCTRKMWIALKKDPTPYIKEAEKEVVFPSGTIVWCRSAESPESLTGEGVKGIVGDEFHMWSPDVWPEYLEPTTLDFNAWVCFLGIPTSDWSVELFQQVQRGERKGWKARQLPTSTNPWINKELIEDKRKNTADWIFEIQYMANIVVGVGSAFSRESVTACVVKNRFEVGYDARNWYVAFFDAAGGGTDEMTLSITHKEPREEKKVMIIQDVLMACLADQPHDRVTEFSNKLKQYGIKSIVGDRYAGEWPRDQFRKHGINYIISTKTASELYTEFQPIVKQGLIEMLDDETQRDQLIGLLRKKGTAKEIITHPVGEHDDRSNSLAGSAVLCQETHGKIDMSITYHSQKRSLATITPRPVQQIGVRFNNKRLIARVGDMRIKQR